MFPNSMSMTSMTGMKIGKKKPRGGRGGKNKRKAVNAHHAQAQTHLTNAANAANPKAALAHMFKGLSALNKAKKPSPTGSAPSAGVPVPPPNVNMAPAGPSSI